MRLIVPVIFIILFVSLIDLYLFRALKIFVKKLSNEKLKKWIYIFHWLIPVLTIIIYLIVNFKVASIREPQNYVYIFTAFGVFFLIYVPKIVFSIFFILEDILNLLLRIFKRTKNRFNYISFIAFPISMIFGFFILYGMLWGKNDLQIQRSQISLSSMPASFNNLKIVQISDWHFGSYGGDTIMVKKICDKVNEEKPDLIFFTGDLVNNFAEETNGYEKYLKGLKAKFGKFSVLGNHDYGDYYKWNDSTEKKENFKKIIEFEEKCEFYVLRNDFYRICYMGNCLCIMGVENWGKPPFKQYGDLKKTYRHSVNKDFKLLLTHDPDHWRAEVLDFDIDITFSGHTHGMQIGFPWFGERKSPASLRFKEWRGIYNEGEKYLHVNVGVGFIGLPARIFMPP